MVLFQGVEQGQGWRPHAANPYKLGQEPEGEGQFPPVGLREQVEVWGFSWLNQKDSGTQQEGIGLKPRHVSYQRKPLVDTGKLVGMSGSPIHYVPKGPNHHWANQFPRRSGVLGGKKNRHHICPCPQNPPWVTASVTIAAAATVTAVAPVAFILGLLIPHPMLDLFLQPT